MESQTVEIKEPELSLEERKAQLLRQGEFYRLGLVHAKAQLRHAVRPDTLIHSVIDYAAWALRTRVDSLLKPTGASLASLMPYAMSVIGFIRSRRMGKASLGVALALAAAGFFLRQRQARQAAF